LKYALQLRSDTIEVLTINLRQALNRPNAFTTTYLGANTFHIHLDLRIGIFRYEANGVKSSLAYMSDPFIQQSIQTDNTV